MEWRTVKEAPEYSVSADGQIKSSFTNRPLKGGTDKDGYRRLVLCTGGRRISRRISRLVCEAFHGPAPVGAVVRHLDGTRDNDAASNLCWGTQAENIADKVQHGTAQRGERHPRAKVTADDVRAIRASSETTYSLGRKYGLAPCSISAIRTRRNWKHID